MIQFLSYAEGPDPTDSSLTLVVISLGIIAMVGLLAAVPATLAKRKSHRHREGIVTALLLWAVLSAGAAIYAANARIGYSKEYNKRVMSGYFDPRDTGDEPKPQWVLWTTLATAYCGIAIWIFSPTAGPARGFDVTSVDR
jgi:hypothetical protein